MHLILISNHKFKTMKKNIYIYPLLTIFFLLVLVSCDKYLDVEPKGKRLLKTVEDYNLWLNEQSLHQSAIYGLTYFSDLRDLPTIDNDWDNTTELEYTWQDQLANDPLNSSPIWAASYTNIYYYNAVIDGIDGATEGTDDERNSLKAEALLGRALKYLELTNLYGKVYNEATASEDLAVPFVTSIDILDEIPNRSTVQEMYDYIIKDLNDAIPYLPADNSANRFRGSVSAAYGVLARTYLYMGNYSLAAENAQLALDNGPNEIFKDAIGAIKDLKIRPDAILSRVGGSGYFSAIIPTLDFLKLHDVMDQRLPVHYKKLGDYSFTTRGTTTYSPYGSTSRTTSYPNWGVDVAEMNLIIAEAAARENDLGTACDQLDLLRSKRFLPEDYVKFESTDQEEILEKILLERVLEFPFCGLRWFDMRRLAAEGRMPTVYRYDALGNIIATLEPNSDRYVLQIPMQVISYNQDWDQNP